MSAEDLERYEADMELQLYQEYRDVLGMFQYVIETERRLYPPHTHPLAFLLEAVCGAETPVRLTGTGVGCACAVPLEHRPGLPPGDLH
jgi:hypothetical protein